jgi:hypothetical protein
MADSYERREVQIFQYLENNDSEHENDMLQ